MDDKKLKKEKIIMDRFTYKERKMIHDHFEKIRNKRLYGDYLTSESGNPDKSINQVKKELENLKKDIHNLGFENEKILNMIKKRECVENMLFERKKIKVFAFHVNQVLYNYLLEFILNESGDSEEDTLYYEIPQFIRDAIHKGKTRPDYNHALFVDATSIPYNLRIRNKKLKREGPEDIIVNPNDWILMDYEYGNLTTCTENYFSTQYERVEEE